MAQKLFLAFPLLALVHLTGICFAYRGREYGSFRSHPVYYLGSLLALPCSAALICRSWPEDVSCVLPKVYRERYPKPVTIGTFLLIGSISFTTMAVLDTTRLHLGAGTFNRPEVPDYFSAVPVLGE